ncbi:MAG: M28 family metallopeptidase [Candidatus Limnocylindria bacterium]
MAGPTEAAGPTRPAAVGTADIAATASPAPTASAAPRTVAQIIERIDAGKLNDHLVALSSFGSRDPRHPGHARAVAYLKEQLRAVPGVDVQSHFAAYNSIPLENVFGVIDPLSGAPPGGWVMICAHYDSIAKNTSGWRPAVDPAPGADDNATGTAALLEYARLLAAERASLKTRVVLAFFDGEELFFKGSAAYLLSLPRPYPYAAVVNIDMVGFNPIADRLDLIWYTAASAALRDRARAANGRYEIGVAPLVEVFAADPAAYILDIAPFGLAGIPSIALTQRYGPPDASYPGNAHFHTVNDAPDKVTNRRLWLKAAKLTLAVALELAR